MGSWHQLVAKCTCCQGPIISGLLHHIFLWQGPEVGGSSPKPQSSQARPPGHWRAATWDHAGWLSQHGVP